MWVLSRFYPSAIRARLGVFKIVTFFFLKRPSHGKVLSRSPWNPPMAKPIKKSHRRKAPAPPEPARRVAPRRATADRRLRMLERLPGLALAHIARGGADGATQTTKHCADAGEPRDRSGGRLRPTANRAAERSDDLSHGRAVCARWVDGSNSTATTASRSRCFGSRGSLVATAHSRAARRELPAPNSVPAKVGGEPLAGRGHATGPAPEAGETR